MEEALRDASQSAYTPWLELSLGWFRPKDACMLFRRRWKEKETLFESWKP